MMLAIKHRPKTFADVIGQDKVIAGLKWLLDRPSETGHAVLLTGPSGNGKTTLAECAARHWGCTELDIIRIESAECDVNRVRDIADHMYTYGAGRDGHKAYIIDEVHTVNGRAADRLLSLLESVPRHVLIIGTTTETDWCSSMLFSRWFRLDLQKVSSAKVAEYLQGIAEAEGLPIPDDPKWAEKLVKYHGLNIRDQLNQLPARLLGGSLSVAA